LAGRFYENLAENINRTAEAYNRRWRIRMLSIVCLFAALALIIGAVLTVGSVNIPFTNVWGILFNFLSGHLHNLLPFLPYISIDGEWSDTTVMIVTGIRLPRIILAGFVGAALAVAGAVYQGLFRNPLADPYLIGVSQGASLGAVIGILLPLTIFGSNIIPILAFIGALAAVAVVYAIARVGKTLPVTTLILAGVAIGAFLTSISSYLILLSGDKVHAIMSWLMGRFSMSSWEQVLIVFPYVLIGIIFILFFARSLNVMQLDEEQAQQLGINVERTKLILLIASTLITAAAVCFVGTIGFVGIIIPHAVRLIWGPDHRSLLPLSALSGAILLILADTASRTVMPPTEVPVGVITAFLGAPFFLFLLRRRKKAVF
jgi:iron complex transport system permease protein